MERDRNCSCDGQHFEGSRRRREGDWADARIFRGNCQVSTPSHAFGVLLLHSQQSVSHCRSRTKWNRVQVLLLHSCMQRQILSKLLEDPIWRRKGFRFLQWRLGLCCLSTHTDMCVRLPDLRGGAFGHCRIVTPLIVFCTAPRSLAYKAGVQASRNPGALVCLALLCSFVPQRATPQY